jgi:hypothetical protein
VPSQRIVETLERSAKPRTSPLAKGKIARETREFADLPVASDEEKLVAVRVGRIHKCCGWMLADATAHDWCAIGVRCKRGVRLATVMHFFDTPILHSKNSVAVTAAPQGDAER